MKWLSFSLALALTSDSSSAAAEWAIDGAGRYRLTPVGHHVLEGRLTRMDGWQAGVEVKYELEHLKGGACSL